MVRNTGSSTSVKNFNGSSQPRYVIPSAPSKYINAGGTTSSKCQVKNCSNSGNNTSHVIKNHGNANKNLYATKLCSKHNNYHNTEPMEVSTNSLIPISKLRN